MDVYPSCPLCPSGKLVTVSIHNHAGLHDSYELCLTCRSTIRYNENKWLRYRRGWDNWLWPAKEKQ